MYATGLHTREDVLKRITALGLRTAKRKPLASQVFERLLKNPLYAGTVHVEKWEIYQTASFEPIIGIETFQVVQALLAGKGASITTRQRFNPEFPLRHFVRCGHCGKPLTGSKAKGRSARYAYYHCQNRHCLSHVSIRT